VNKVLDFGTFTGCTSLAMAEALREVGRLVTLEREQMAAKMAAENLAESWPPAELGCTACTPWMLLHAGRGLQRAAHGKVSGTLGSSSCDHCPAGNCSVSAGTTAELGCTACAPGMFSTLGASCNACPMGRRASPAAAGWARVHAEKARRADAQAHGPHHRARLHDLRPRHICQHSRADAAAVGKLSGRVGASSRED
jgi:hypothetical protein